MQRAPPRLHYEPQAGYYASTSTFPNSTFDSTNCVDVVFVPLGSTATPAFESSIQRNLWQKVYLR